VSAFITCTELLAKLRALYMQFVAMMKN